MWRNWLWYVASRNVKWFRHCKKQFLQFLKLSIEVIFVVAVQSLSRVQHFVTPWTVAGQAPLSSTISQKLLKFMCIESVMLSNHFILCCPLLLPSIFPRIRVFSNEWVLCIRWPKYWSFSNSPSNEYSGLISFRIDWFDLCAVQGILKRNSPTLQFESINLWCSAFFMAQLSHS